MSRKRLDPDSKTVRLFVRIPAGLLRLVDALAKKNGRTRSEEIRARLTNAVKNDLFGGCE